MNQAIVWPADLGFQTLAHAVRDGVTWAINNGWEIRTAQAHRGDRHCCCPLGAYIQSKSIGLRTSTSPTPTLFQRWLPRGSMKPSMSMLWCFIYGFDQGTEAAAGEDEILRACRRLGIWYRKRFTGKGAARHSVLTHKQRAKLSQTKTRP